MLGTIDFPILSLITFLPALGIIILMLIPSGKDEKGIERSKKMMRWVAVGITFSQLVLAAIIYFAYNSAKVGINDLASYQFVEKVSWISATLPLVGNINIEYFMGIDGLSVPMVLLTALISFVAVFPSFGINKAVRGYFAMYLLLDLGMMGVFCALDFFLFYIFWELMLLPMYFLIGIWGGPRKEYAAIKFFIYTFAGSLFMLIGMIYIAYTHYHTTGVLTFSLIEWYKLGFSFDVQYWLFLAFFLGFAIKVPMFPFHTWLPYAHGQAPTIGSVILAAVLLKMGSYGFIRFSLPMFPDATVYFIPMVAILSLIMVVYTAMIAYAQSDMKQVIAYSSVSHMGVVILGTFALNPEGITGSVFLMISHGIVSGALFLLVGVIYDRLHTKEMSKFGGITKVMPMYSIVFGITLMASVGLPLTIGFVGEFLSLLGFYRVSPIMTAIAGTTIILGAVYMLALFKKSFFGEITNPDVRHLKDLNAREITVFVPIVILIVVLGIYPKPILEPIDKSSREIVKFMHSKASTDTKLQIESYNKVGVK